MVRASIKRNQHGLLDPCFLNSRCRGIDSSGSSVTHRRDPWSEWAIALHFLGAGAVQAIYSTARSGSRAIKMVVAGWAVMVPVSDLEGIQDESRPLPTPSATGPWRAEHGPGGFPYRTNQPGPGDDPQRKGRPTPCPGPRASQECGPRDLPEWINWFRLSGGRAT
jgi:hypothetical protein